jgi:hypothetical protein
MAPPLFASLILDARPCPFPPRPFVFSIFVDSERLCFSRKSPLARQRISFGTAAFHLSSTCTCLRPSLTVLGMISHTHAGPFATPTASPDPFNNPHHVVPNVADDPDDHIVVNGEAWMKGGSILTARSDA